MKNKKEIIISIELYLNHVKNNKAAAAMYLAD